MGCILAKHNSKIRNRQDSPPPPGCNCRGGPPTCPVGGECLSECVVYQATVTNTVDNTIETYTGLTSRKFKTRYYEHTADMRDQNRNGTGLSNHIWKLKNNNTPFKITWKILEKRPPFNPISKVCKLCLREKFLIMFRPEGATLNNRNKNFATCRHRLKPLISNN